jgi:hypothetical protein
MTGVQHFDTGLSKYADIDVLYSGRVNKKIICRLDLTTALNAYFSDDFIQKYRSGLVSMAQGVMNPELMPAILSAFLKEDAKFRARINVLFSMCPIDSTFGDYIPYGLAQCMLEYMDAIHDNWVGHPEFIICESDGYLYFSVPKDYDLSDGEYEVVSND